MRPDQPLIRNISDTARWVAMYRAQETERKDALFRDPFAARLAGERGRAIAELMQGPLRDSWPFTTRTYLFDGMVQRAVAEGADTVLNLAAGLDARPYRMALPQSLRWIEIDLPPILEEKQALLAGDTPVCRLERVKLDLADVAARRAAFERIAAASQRTLVLCEGLLIYLHEHQVATLARDLAAHSSFQHWVVDISSPGLLRMIQRTVASKLDGAGASMHFAPSEGTPYFEPHGWTPVEVHPMLKTAARLGRLNWWMKLLSRLPDSTGRQGSRPWSAVCRLERKG